MKDRIYRYHFAVVVCTSFLLQGAHLAADAAPASSPQSSSPQKVAPPSSPYSVSGPYSSNNLSVYLIRGPEKIKGQDILTLEEGLSRKLVKVQETSNVNELRVQNLSNSVVFLQSGDIVRGGKQDRAIQFDMMLPPKATKPLPVFCVEHDRWQQRGTESANGFESSSNQLAGRKLKLAAKKVGDQGTVWESVGQIQGKLCQRLGPRVQSASPSPSSFELTMNNNDVKAATKSHIDKLNGLSKGQADVVGFAFAINGKLNAADIYASNQLFQKLYPKLLKSAAAEAVAESTPSAGKTQQAVAAPNSEEVKKFMADAESKPIVNKSSDKGFVMTEQESRSSVMYKTKWFAAPSKTNLVAQPPSVKDYRDVHVNYISK